MASLRSYFSILWNGSDLGLLKPTDGLEFSNDDIVRYRKWQWWYQRLLEGSLVIALIGLWLSGIRLVNYEHSATAHRMWAFILVGFLLVLVVQVLLLSRAGLAFSSLSSSSTSKYGCDETLKKCALSEQAEHYRQNVTSHRELMVLDAWFIARLAKDEQEEIAFKQLRGVVG